MYNLSQGSLGYQHLGAAVVRPEGVLLKLMDFICSKIIIIFPAIAFFFFFLLAFWDGDIRKEQRGSLLNAGNS